MYNNNILSNIPVISKTALNFIKNYFYLYNTKIDNKIRRKKIYNRQRRLSMNNIFLSKGEFKHTNNKVIITLYIYNKQKNNYLKKLKRRYIRFLKISNLSKKNKMPKGLVILKKLKKISINSILTLINLNFFNPIVAKIISDLQEQKKINNLKVVSSYVNKFYRRYNRRFLKRLFLYIYYKRLIYINKSKFNYTYLQFIKNKLQVIFNKNIEFNFINLKYFFLDSNILSESILLKIKKNRKKLIKHLSNLRRKVRIKKRIGILGKLVRKNKLNNKVFLHNNTLLFENIFNNLKYKHLSGFRLEAKGRLNKRHTAARSIYKFVYKGSLLNVDSSYKGLSTVLLRNNLNTNLQYTKLNSKTRIGSFGLKG